MMSQSQYSLTWEAHVRNVCDGLSSLQQNGEFVDMTLAADGHMVKVHQVVLALASPYFKELITSAQCPHPVIFLSKITHATLSAILEYIYTGEVLVSLEHLNDLIEAAKELHIKGLKDMKVQSSLMETSKQLAMGSREEEMPEDQGLCLFQVAQENDDEFQDKISENITGTEDPHSALVYEDGEDNNIEQEMQHESDDQNIDENIPDTDNNLPYDIATGKIDPTCSALQYTVSNQGSLQMILNRFVYYLKYTTRDKSRQWRCVDYLSHTAKCPAHVFTKDDIVVHRIAAHTHPFHDKKILKKLRNGVVFTAFTEAEREGDIKKKKTLNLGGTE